MCYGSMARNHVRNMVASKGNGLLPGPWMVNEYTAILT